MAISAPSHKICRTVSSQLRNISTIGKKLVKQQYVLHTSPEYGELRPINSWDLLVSLGHPSKFQWVSRLCFVTAVTSLDAGKPNFVQCLAIFCAGTLYVHFPGLLTPNGILPHAKLTLLPGLAFFYIGTVTARHSSRGRQTNCSVQQRAPPIFCRAAITLGIGSHSSLHLELA